MRKFELVVLLSGLLVSACSTGESNTQSIRRTLDELDRGDEAVRAKAALALGTPRVFNADRTTVQAVVKALIKGLSDESAHVRAASAASLGQFGSFAKLGSRSKETVRSLAQGLRDPSEDVRCTAASSLHLIGDPARDALPEITEALNDTDPSVRRAVIDCLAYLGRKDGKIRGLIIKLLDDPDASVRLKAREALRRDGKGVMDAREKRFLCKFADSTQVEARLGGSGAGLG